MCVLSFIKKEGDKKKGRAREKRRSQKRENQKGENQKGENQKGVSVHSNLLSRNYFFLKKKLYSYI